ncbi:uncharacterized protein EMH_0049690 [Eimeria mitis]|uniref:Uncharacterized protein n=1 Tax=Eimeria mitis TaxID=44415 RepID=U6K5F1_9EIME|nr:uncharacterized protein EMH_0049690 [Eimeria mitis]CDJ32979.1 hypothetical protein, conserved [Eimeria mitis]
MVHHMRKCVTCSDATAESNMRVLLDVLGDNEMLEALEGEKRQTCAQLQATACPEYFKSISCDTVNMIELRQSLIQAETQISSSDGAPEACTDALRQGLMLFDIFVISEPLKEFQRDPSAGPRHALNHLFSTLNLASKAGVQQQAEQQSAEAARPTTGGGVVAEEFIEMKRLKNKSKATQESPERTASSPGSLQAILSEYPEAYLAFAGTGGPIASLIVNWFTQAFLRFDEFFGENEGNRRPLAPLPKLLSSGHEHRLSSLPRTSCDLMLQATFALHLAEMHAIERINSLQQMLPPEELEYSLPLELYAGGRMNFQRLCMGFSSRRGAEVLLDVPCLYEDTVLASIEANAEKTGAAAEEGTSLLESTEQEQREAPSRAVRKNALLDFLLLQLRGGNYKAAAHLLGNDSAPSWQNEVWDKRLHCQSKLVSLQCSALGNFFDILDRRFIGQIGDLLNSTAKEAACGSATAKCPKKAVARQSPLKALGSQPTVLSQFLPRGPVGEGIFRIFVLLSGNRWKNSKELVSCSDGVENILRNFTALVSDRATSVLLSRWLPRAVQKLMKKHLRRKYSRRHFRFLSSKLPSAFYMKLRSCVDVVVHPLVFEHLNQLAFTGSEPSGARSRAGGISERLDKIIAETATQGLPQQLKKKLQAGEKTTMKDFNGINFSLVHPPTPKTWQEYLRLELEDSLVAWLMRPGSRERIQHECRGGRGSNIAALFRDSLDLLKSSDTENLALIGKVVSPKETSVGRPLRLKSFIYKLLRLPSYKTQHHSFVAINLRIREALELVRVLVEVYTQNKGVFENQEVFMTAVIDLFEHFEEKSRTTSGGPLGASSFGMVLMGGDVGLRLFNQMLPTTQKRMLKKAKYGSPTVFTSQMQLTGSLLSASGHSGLGMFLHAQSVYFGLMIKKWVQKRTEDRIREIISWLTLGLFFASSLVQVTEGVTEIASTGNETGQASMTTGCPPIGLCMDDSGNAFVGNPTGSPALTALQAIMKTGIMASIAVFAGPLIAVYNIAVSQFSILSRLEMAIGNTCKQLVSRLAKSKTITNIKELFATKQDRMKSREAAAAKKNASLGDEVEQSLTAFFQGHEQKRCQQ